MRIIFKFPLNSFLFKTFFFLSLHGIWIQQFIPAECSKDITIWIHHLAWLVFLACYTWYFYWYNIKKTLFPSVIRNYPIGNNKWEINDCRVFIHVELVPNLTEQVYSSRTYSMMLFYLLFTCSNYFPSHFLIKWTQSWKCEW